MNGDLSIDALLSDPQRARDVTREQAQDILVRFSAVQPLLMARAMEAAPDNGPEFIKLKEAAKVSGVPATWFYDHWQELSFFTKKGGLIMANRRGLEEWMTATNGR